MVHQIGHAAGEVWHHLESSGPCTIEQIKKGLQIKETILLMALGWLAREGKLSFERVGKAVRISISQ